MLRVLVLLATVLVAPCIHAAGVTATELKAVFVYKLSHFVDWPADSFAASSEPLVIGVLGSDTFAALLEEVVRGEHIDDHPIQVRRIRAADAIGPVHILYVDQSGSDQLAQVVAAMKGRAALTVSDQEGAAQRGAMIQLANVDNKIRMRINVESARAAGLTLSSNLLRSAEIVRNGGRN